MIHVVFKDGVGKLLAEKDLKERPQVDDFYRYSDPAVNNKNHIRTLQVVGITFNLDNDSCVCQVKDVSAK